MNLKTPQKTLRKRQENSPSKASTANFKNADFSWRSLKVTKFKF